MQDKIEPFTKPENSLLTYLFWKYREGCYDEMEVKGNWEYKNALGDLQLLSEIERKLEAHLT